MTAEEIKNIKEGDRLIFVEHGGVLSTSKGNVFTFWKWHESSVGGKNEFWKCIELKDNPYHNFGVWSVELFDENIHKEYNIMTSQKLNNNVIEFIKKFG